MSKKTGAQEPGFVYEVNLDEISRPLTVVFRGKKYTVKPIDGDGFQLLSKIQKGRTTSIEVTETMYRLVEMVLEDSGLDKKDIRTMTVPQVAEVVRLAANGARMVEGMANPNSERPAASKPRGRKR